ncbi:MAG: nucleotide exchange factor GrpE [Methanobacteriota archaeon]|nr:MAG: nucleotide exchange factor GrpE [Euryarchaeota archaeon]
MGSVKKEGSQAGRRRRKEKALSGKEIQKELEKKRKEAEEYLNQLKYLKADFENYRKRVEREKEALMDRAKEELVLEILEAVDNLERALEAGKGEKGTKESLMEGVNMIYRQLMAALARHGVEPIKALGEPFNPHLHECVLTEKNDDLEEDTVTEEIQKGYTMKDRVIRHSKVKVSKR